MPTLFDQSQQHPEPTGFGGRTHAVDGSHKVTLVSSYAYRPTSLKFENQEKSEEVILFLRQHLIVFIPWLFVGAFLLFVPTVGLPLFFRFARLPVEIPFGYIIVGTLFWYVAVFGFIFQKFLHWFFNIYIVTNERIIDIDFVHLLYKEFSEASINRVQDITYSVRGIFATMFNFGDVVIQTAGELPNFRFEGVPRPSDVVDIIGDIAHVAHQSGARE